MGKFGGSLERHYNLHEHFKFEYLTSSTTCSVKPTIRSCLTLLEKWSYKRYLQKNLRFLKRFNEKDIVFLDGLKNEPKTAKERDEQIPKSKRLPTSISQGLCFRWSHCVLELMWSSRVALLQWCSDIIGRVIFGFWMIINLIFIIRIIGNIVIWHQGLGFIHTISIIPSMYRNWGWHGSKRLCCWVSCFTNVFFRWYDTVIFRVPSIFFSNNSITRPEIRSWLGLNDIKMSFSVGLVFMLDQYRRFVVLDLAQQNLFIWFHIKFLRFHNA